MSYKASIAPKAIIEVYESSDWYEERQLGLGYRFEKEVASKIISIAKNPFHYSLKGKYHEASLNDFPFLILYEIDQESKIVIIASVFHMSRHLKTK